MYSLTQEQIDQVKTHWPDQAEAIQALGDKWKETQAFFGSNSAISRFVDELKERGILEA